MVLVDVYLWIALILTALAVVAASLLGIMAIVRRRRSRRVLMVSLLGLEMAGEQREAQRRSFAYGNTNLSNRAVTRETVDQAADRLDAADDDPRRRDDKGHEAP
jgi:hypothetical protein